MVVMVLVLGVLKVDKRVVVEFVERLPVVLAETNLHNSCQEPTKELLPLL